MHLALTGEPHNCRSALATTARIRHHAFVSIVRDAWRKPPSEQQRWIGAHPILWIAIVVGIGFVVMAGSLTSGDGLLVALVFGALVLAALAAWLGVVLRRRRIAAFDSRQSGNT